MSAAETPLQPSSLYRASCAGRSGNACNPRSANPRSSKFRAITSPNASCGRICSYVANAALEKERAAHAMNISFTLRRRSQSKSALGGMADAARDAALGEDRKVFVGGIPFGVDQNVVREDFMQFGDIEDVYLPIDRDNGKLRGFAFVTYRYSKDAHAACGAMHGRDYHGRQITVNIAKPRGPREDGKGSGPPAGSNSSQYSYSRPRDYDRGFDERRHDGDSRQSGSNVRDRDRDERDERDGDRFAPRYSHGNSYDGSGRYGDRDPRPARQYYD